jgi:acyl transferase domain-containing protein
MVINGCRFAGKFDSPSKLWELLQELFDVRREIFENRLSAHVLSSQRPLTRPQKRQACLRQGL